MPELAREVSFDTILLLIISILLVLTGFFGSNLYFRITKSIDKISEELKQNGDKIDSVDKKVYGIRVYLGLENGASDDRDRENN